MFGTKVRSVMPPGAIRVDKGLVGAFRFEVQQPRTKRVDFKWVLGEIVGLWRNDRPVSSFWLQHDIEDAEILVHFAFHDPTTPNGTTFLLQPTPVRTRYSLKETLVAFLPNIRMLMPAATKGNGRLLVGRSALKMTRLLKEKLDAHLLMQLNEEVDVDQPAAARWPTFGPN